MPIYGKFGDVLGRRRLFLIAIALFTLASVGCAFAGDFWMFVTFRAMQGLGAGGLMILSQAIIADIVPAIRARQVPRPARRGLRPLGRRRSAARRLLRRPPHLAVGVLHQHPGRHRRVRHRAVRPHAAEQEGHEADRHPRRVFLSAATTCLIFFTDFGGDKDFGWSSPATWAWGVGLLAAVAGFIIAEARAEDPIIPLSLFRNPIFVNATAIGLTLGLGMFAAIGFVPTFLQMSSGTSAAASGLLMIPMMVGLMGTSIVSGILITRTGPLQDLPDRRHRSSPASR